MLSQEEVESNHLTLVLSGED